jgi:hypothetical protein
VAAAIAISAPAAPAVSDAPIPAPRPAARVPARVAARDAMAAAASESRLEVLVPPDQAIAVRRLLLMHAAGRRFALASDGHAVDEVKGTLLELAPVEIPRVTIDLLPGPEPGVGGKVK